MGLLHVHQEGPKLNNTDQFIVYADDVNILGGSVHTIKKNAEALAIASKETGLGINADKTEYTVMSRDQNAGESHNMKTENKSFEGLEQWENPQESKFHSGKLKSRLQLGDAFYHSVQQFVSSSLLLNNIKKYSFACCFIWM
jgi:hypothetical protein